MTTDQMTDNAHVLVGDRLMCDTVRETPEEVLALAVETIKEARPTEVRDS